MNLPSQHFIIPIRRDRDIHIVFTGGTPDLEDYLALAIYVKLFIKTKKAALARTFIAACESAPAPTPDRGAGKDNL